jgi:hypothetical protein
MNKAKAYQLDYGKDWQKISREMRAKYPFCLDPLGIHPDFLTESQEVHHVIPFKLASSRLPLSLVNSPLNLIPVCRRCHESLEKLAANSVYPSLFFIFDLKRAAISTDSAFIQQDSTDSGVTTEIYCDVTSAANRNFNFNLITRNQVSDTPSHFLYIICDLFGETAKDTQGEAVTSEIIETSGITENPTLNRQGVMKSPYGYTESLTEKIMDIVRPVFPHYFVQSDHTCTDSRSPDKKMPVFLNQTSCHKISKNQAYCSRRRCLQYSMCPQCQ